jgi:Flp pilus assembly protein TadG
MRRQPRTLHRRGQAILDAALVFPILLSLTFGSIEFGHYFYVKHTLQGAAREGARAAATGTSMTEVTDAVARSMGAAGFAASKYTVAVFKVTGTDAQGNPTGPQLTSSDITSSLPTTGTPLLVKVYCTWGTVGIRPMRLLDATRQVNGTTVMRRES